LFWITRLGETGYEEAFRLQQDLRRRRLDGLLPDLLLLTSHPPVYTLGKRDCSADFLSPPEVIEQEGIAVVKTNRGGKITYHGPGQVVGYFIADLRSLRMGIPDFVRAVEEVLIRVLSCFRISGQRDPEHPGVWVGEKKIAALGLHIDRGVTLHGFALNVNPILDHYRHIIPCGIAGRSVTSMEKELGKNPDIRRVEDQIEKQMAEVFTTPVENVVVSKVLKSSDR